MAWGRLCWWFKDINHLIIWLNIITRKGQPTFAQFFCTCQKTFGDQVLVSILINFGLRKTRKFKSNSCSIFLSSLPFNSLNSWLPTRWSKTTKPLGPELAHRINNSWIRSVRWFTLKAGKRSPNDLTAFLNILTFPKSFTQRAGASCSICGDVSNRQCLLVCEPKCWSSPNTALIIYERERQFLLLVWPNIFE